MFFKILFTLLVIFFLLNTFRKPILRYLSKLVMNRIQREFQKDQNGYYKHTKSNQNEFYHSEDVKITIKHQRQNKNDDKDIDIEDVDFEEIK